MAAPASGAAGRRRGPPGLTVRLLLLTAVVFLVVVVLICFPSISQFRLEYLHEQLEKAELSTLVVEAAGGGEIPPRARERLLAFTDTEAIILRTGAASRLMIGETPKSIDRTVRLSMRMRSLTAAPAQWAMLVPDTLGTLLHGERRLIRVVGPAMGGDEMIVEVVTHEEGLARALRAHAGRVIGVSLVLCAVIGGLLFAALRWIIVRPVKRIERRLASFARTPEDESTTVPDSGRGDEIGQLERSLASMQTDLRAALRRRRREAALGGSVSKLNHDLRNILTVAMTSSDQIAESVAKSGDPLVRQVMQHLINSVNRAALLCTRTLDYIRHGDRPPDIRDVPLRGMVDEVGEMVEPFVTGTVRWGNSVPRGLVCRADSEQLFRALLNLAENAVSAVGKGGRVEISARATIDGVAIEVRDNGPGLDKEARAIIEAPASAGTVPARGLGLVIVREIVAAHRGTLRVVRSSPEGTVLEITLQDR